jgi:cytidylate kinase
VEPFVTLSREPGAGAWTLAHPLTEALNRECSGGERPWTCWDRELVEKVAADHHIAQQLVDSLEDAHSWLSDFLSSLSTSDSPEVADEARVFGKVASTIRALASAGRVVIVGRGGVFLTRHMPGGVHVRLVAPLEKRVANMAAYLSVSREQAAARVREMTKARDAFYRRYWPQEPLRPELFTATLNTAALAPQTVIRVIVELVREAATAPVANPLSAAAAASRSSEA